jgi:hypothetical protein
MIGQHRSLSTKEFHSDAHSLPIYKERKEVPMMAQCEPSTKGDDKLL